MAFKPIEFPPHLLEETEDTETDISRESEADDSDADLEDEDTTDEEDLDSSEDSEDEEVDTDEEDAGDETDEEEEEEQTEDEDSGEETEEDSEASEDAFLPPFDRKKLLAEHPELEAPYKHMQAAFTRKMQAVSEAQTEAELLREQLTDFVETLQTDEGAEEFLERVALVRPEVFQKVVERFEEILADDDVKEQRVREIKLKDREKQIEQRDKADEAKKVGARIQEVVQIAESTAEAENLTDEDSIAIAKQFVLAKINENKAKTGKAEISNDEVVSAVKAAAKHVRAQIARVEKQVQQKNRVADKDKAKKKLKQSKRPAPAGTKSKSSPSKKPQAPKGMDPVHYALQKRLGLID